MQRDTQVENRTAPLVPRADGGEHEQPRSEPQTLRAQDVERELGGT